MRTDWKPEPREKKKRVPLKRTPLRRTYKATGELPLMKLLFEKRGRRCQVTGNRIYEFSVWNAVHVLGKKAYPKFRLSAENIIIAEKEFHHLYDNDTKEKVLRKYPKAEWVFSLKQQLKTRYNELYSKR